VSEEAVEQWMTSAVCIDPVLGGEIRIDTQGWPVVTGEIIAFEPPRLFAVAWQREDWGVTLHTTIKVVTEGDQTRLVLDEVGHGNDADLLRTRDYLWSHWLVRLTATVAQGQGPGIDQRRAGHGALPLA